MKPLISSMSKKSIEKYSSILSKAGFHFQVGMDLPNHPNDFLISVDEMDYRKAMKVLYPNRNTPKISFTDSYHYIIVKGYYPKSHVFTKEDSCYLKSKIILPDYQTEEKALEIAKYHNDFDPFGYYRVVKV